MVENLDHTDRSAWWRRDGQEPLRAPGLHLTHVGLDGRDHAEPYTPHWQRRQYGWVYLLAGRGFVESAACGRLEIGPGDVVVCLPEHWHYYGPLPGERWVEVFCFVDGPLPESLRRHDELPSAPVLHAGLDPEIRSPFLDLVAAARRDDAASCGSLWYHLVTRLAQARPHRLGAQPRDRYAQALQGVVDRLCADPGRDWSLHRLADELGLGYDAFRKAFTRRYRMSPGAFLRRERLHLACRELWLGTSVQDTATRVGYHDPFSFSRQFKRQFGRSPRAYAQSLRGDGS